MITPVETAVAAADTEALLQRDPALVQGGDLASFPPAKMITDLSICANRYGPPPSALDALRRLVDERPGDLIPPPYQAEELYLQAFADHLGTEAELMLPGGGVTEFFSILARIWHRDRVAVVTPDNSGTVDLFSYATFLAPPNPARDTVEARLSRVHHALKNHDAVLLSNPSNPLGHYIPREALVEAARQRPQSLLVIDEECVAFQGGEGVSYVGADADNIVILQSSGKAYGLVGVRAGVL